MQTNWKETVGPNEAALFETYAQKIVAIQKKHSADQGPGRGLHRKQVAALEGRFQVRADLPAELRHGIFASPADSRVLIRLSNGAQRKQKDSIPDIRGFAFRVFGVSGPSALGNGTVDSQDFLCIDRTHFGVAHVSDFIEVLEAVEANPIKVFPLFFRKYGLVGMFRKLNELGVLPPKKFTSFATETFSTVAPLRFGPYAARLRIVPQQHPGKKRGKDWKEDLLAWLADGSLAYEVQAQFFENEQSTPIEDHSVDWTTPWISVGTLTVPRQNESAALQAEVEALRFDPWNALEDHRPLGNVMRARKAAYYASAQARSPVAAG